MPVSRDYLQFVATISPDWLSVVREALLEDRAREDVTTALLGEARNRPAQAGFVGEERFVLAGSPAIETALLELDGSAQVGLDRAEGDWVESGKVFATARSRAGALLGAERAVLNILQHLSGVATATRRLVDRVAGTGARITHTRKTLPGLRAVELYAVQLGGGVLNRASLADAVLWKDNHWSLLGDPSGLGRALAGAPPGCEVAVEVETEAQLEAALAAGVRHLLVDNQAPGLVARWVGRAGPGVIIQASGGITETTVRAYAETGAHLLAVGQITHSARAAGIRCEVL